MKTALQQAIEKANIKIAECQAIIDKQISKQATTVYTGKRNALKDFVDELILLLPTEQEIIEQAYKYGQMSIDKMDSGATFSTKSASEYYTETFKTDKDERIRR